MKTSKKLSKPLLLALLVAVLLAVTAVVWWKMDKKEERPAASPAAIRKETINYAPATKQEKAETEAHKRQLTEQQANQNATQGQKKAVKPIISYAGQDGFQIEVDAYVGGIIENEGTCSLRLTSGQNVIEKTSAATGDASTTICAPFILQQTQVSNGTWAAVVSYSSTTAEGVSAPTTFTVQ